ncbi:hypothetical protein APT_00382 [Acetobacter pasteurianus NBRC 101655]|nr:hypothetical protein APT_00382 [Acetobacter pasteurianus NBRC 101655]
MLCLYWQGRVWLFIRLIRILYNGVSVFLCCLHNLAHWHVWGGLPISLTDYIQMYMPFAARGLDGMKDIKQGADLNV